MEEVAITAGVALAVGGPGFVITRALVERQKRLVEGRAAARMIEDEISTGMSLIESSLVKGVWLDDPAEIISTARWDEHQAALARAPRFKGWYSVTSTTSHLKDIQRRATQGGVRRGTKIGKGDLPEEYLGLCVIGCETALEPLQKYAKTKTYKSERVKDLQRLLNDVLEEYDNVEFEPEPNRPRAKGASENHKGKRKAAKQARKKNR